MPFTNTTSLILDGVDERGTGVLGGISRPFSITCWIKFGRLNQSGNTDFVLSLGAATFDRMVSIRREATTDKIACYVRSGNHIGQAITGQVWHHVALLINTTNPKIDMYVDNVQQTMDSQPTTAPSIINGNIMIGAYVGGPSLYFDGNLNNLAIWGKLLTSDDRDEIYNAGVTPDLAGVSAFSDIIPWWQSTDGDTHPVLTDNQEVGDITMVNTEAADFLTADVPSTVLGGSINMSQTSLQMGIGSF